MGFASKHVMTAVLRRNERKLEHGSGISPSLQRGEALPRGCRQEKTIFVVLAQTGHTLSLSCPLGSVTIAQVWQRKRLGAVRKHRRANGPEQEGKKKEKAPVSDLMQRHFTSVSRKWIQSRSRLLLWTSAGWWCTSIKQGTGGINRAKRFHDNSGSDIVIARQP